MNKHVFQCRNMGAIASGSKMSLAFQFAITNTGKSFKTGATGATNNYVVQKVTSLACELSIDTYKSAGTSSTNWYLSTLTMSVDGNGESSRSGRW